MSIISGTTGTILQNMKRNYTTPDHASKISPGEWYDYLTKSNQAPQSSNPEINTQIEENCKERVFNELDFAIKLEEVQAGIKKIKVNKAVGLDKISNEMLKHCTTDTLLCITKVFNKILISGTYPQNWGKGYIVNIHKKGSHFDPRNYRGITITSSLSKLFNLILNTRLQNYLTKNKLIAPEQIGFEKGSSTSDHIFTLKTIIEKYTKRKTQKLYACFVDYRQAFDRIWHEGLLFKLTKLGINNIFYNIVKSMYNNIELQIKIGDKLTDAFQSNIGVRQGDNLSPTLFKIFINDLVDRIKDTENTHPVEIGEYIINALLYADDIVLLSTTKEGLQNTINVLKQYSDTWQLEVNLNKTKVLTFNEKRSNLANQSFYYGTQTIEQVEKYTYLGIEVTANGTFKQAMDTLQSKGLKGMY